MTDRMFDVPVDRQRLAEILYAHAFSGSNQNFEMRCHTCDAWIPRPEGVTNFRQQEAIHQAEMVSRALDGSEGKGQ